MSKLTVADGATPSDAGSSNGSGDRRSSDGGSSNGGSSNGYSGNGYSDSDSGSGSSSSDCSAGDGSPANGGAPGRGVVARSSALQAGLEGPFRDFYDQWFPVALAADVPRHRPLRLHRLGVEMVVWRDARGQVCGGSNWCPHRRASLGEGCVREGRLSCPYHGFVFDSRGECLEVPAEGRSARIPRALAMDMFELREEHGVVWLWFGGRRSAYPEIPFFKAPYARKYASAAVSYVSPYGFERFTENALDLSHFSFVHARALKVAGPRVHILDARNDGGRFEIRFAYADEQTGEKQAQPYQLEFQYPATATLAILPGVLYVIGQCPIDEDRTWFFSFVHQSYCLVPGLSWLVCKLILWFEKLFVLPSDYAILRHQAKRKPAAPEVHLPSDVPITMWYQERQRMRQRLARAHTPGQAGARGAEDDEALLRPDTPLRLPLAESIWK